jgi:hypothetical protein
MRNYEFSVTAILKQMGLFSLPLCGIVYVYGGIVLIPGLFIGLLTGIAYFFHLYYQIGRLTKYPTEKAPAYIRWGWMGRFCMLIAILILLGCRLDIGYAAFIVGFFTMPVILFFNSMVLLLKQIIEARKNGKERGCKQWGMVKQSGDISL